MWYILKVLMELLTNVLQKTFTKHHSWNICFRQHHSLPYSRSQHSLLNQVVPLLQYDKAPKTLLFFVFDDRFVGIGLAFIKAQWVGVRQLHLFFLTNIEQGYYHILTTYPRQILTHAWMQWSQCKHVAFQSVTFPWWCHRQRQKSHAGFSLIGSQLHFYSLFKKYVFYWQYFILNTYFLEHIVLLLFLINFFFFNISWYPFNTYHFCFCKTIVNYAKVALLVLLYAGSTQIQVLPGAAGWGWRAVGATGTGRAVGGADLKQTIWYNVSSQI